MGILCTSPNVPKPRPLLILALALPVAAFAYTQGMARIGLGTPPAGNHP
jgi:hypothetical protein